MNSEVSYKLHRITASLYVALGLGLAALAVQVYLSGYYQAILLPTLFTPVFFALGIWRWQTASLLKHDPAAIAALIALGVFLIFQPETLTDITQWHWVSLCYPLLAFYLLPTSISLAFSLLLLAGLLNLRLYSETLEMNITFSGNYLLLLLIAWLYSIRCRIKTKQLEQLVGVDKITGFFNKRHLDIRLNAEVSRARATKKPLVLLLVELHQYPQIQQELGKTLSNNFIREAGNICRINCRVGDEPYRYDEQTLLLLMPNTTINGALVLRARLYQHLLQEVACDIGPLDASITPLVLQVGESIKDFQQRIADSCYHSLSERVTDNLS